LSKLNVSLFK